jgi:cytochrome P450
MYEFCERFGVPADRRPFQVRSPRCGTREREARAAETAGRSPLLGHTVPFVRDPLGTLERWADSGDDLVQGEIAGRRFCLGASPGAARRVLATDASAYRKADIVRENLGTLQGGRLVLLEGEEWRERRRLLRSGFDRRGARAAGSLATRQTAAAIDDWSAEVRIDERMRSLSLGVLAEALFGMDVGERSPVHEAADDVLARMNPRTLSAFLPEWVPTPTNRRFRAAVATLHDRIDDVVAAASPPPDGEGLLAAMLAAGLDPERVRDELVALLFAGYDSTATALAVTLSLVGDHPEVQTRLRGELARTPDGPRPTPADLEALPVLDAVVRESLRLYPPQYVLLREPVESRTLCGYRVDQGTTVVVSPWVCGRDDSHWEAPSRFRPSRWRTGRDRPAFVYFPYGGGPRHCLGRTLAERTIRLVVAVVCRRRRLRLQGDLSVSAGPTLSPGPLELRAVRDTV